MMAEFFIGLHQPSDAKHFEQACISIKRLWNRKKSLGRIRVLVDSGAFTELKIHGEYKIAAEIYAKELYRLWTEGLVNIVGAVSQDYMCETFMLARTGLTVVDHQRLTIERYDAIRAELIRLFEGEPPFPLMPVLQGYTPSEYEDHLRAYGHRVKFGMWVGVGSVCKRNGDPEQVAEVLARIKRMRPDINLHGFGIKFTSLGNWRVRALLTTADSMAWSYSALKQGRNPNSWIEAANYAARVNEIAGLAA